MNLALKTRTADHVRIYFSRTQDPEIREMLPSGVQTLEEALANFAQAQKPDAASYGRTIYVDEEYVGDIWCYCIDPSDEPQAMDSYCIFEKSRWNQGIATAALGEFLKEIVPKYSLQSIGAFTYSANLPSIQVLVRNGFTQRQVFTEDGRESRYFQLDIM